MRERLLRGLRGAGELTLLRGLRGAGELTLFQGVMTATMMVRLMPSRSASSGWDSRSGGG